MDDPYAQPVDTEEKKSSNFLRKIGFIGVSIPPFVWSLKYKFYVLTYIQTYMTSNAIIAPYISSLYFMFASPLCEKWNRDTFVLR